ncbi:MAG: tryptophan synthase subunit alpha [Firmicutes bacterium]|nr:tryptophan synthase subunit alpha [Bacillota bacterium]
MSQDSAISAAFRLLQGGSRKALIPYVTAGDGGLGFTRDLVLALEDAGCNLVELGVPYSDPVADGPTIQLASERALKGGVTISKIMEMCRGLKDVSRIPRIFMVYYNCVFRYGPQRFVGEAAHSGVSGLIVPDLPPEEGGELEELTARSGLDLVYLLAPTSTDRRISKVARHSRGFIYCVSLTGVTGARQAMSAELEGFISRVRRATTMPLAVGFGISTPGHAREAGRFGDGVIVGSALIDVMSRTSGGKAALAEVRSFASSLRRALDEAWEGTAAQAADKGATLGAVTGDAVSGAPSGCEVRDNGSDRDKGKAGRAGGPGLGEVPGEEGL